MNCGACGTANDAGRKFCRECGTRLALACPSCGAPNAADDKFCGDCGAPLATSGATTTRPYASGAAGPYASGQAGPGNHAGDPAGSGSAAATDTERRLVSVLFVDLVGFTAFSESRDAEDVRAMLSQYFDAASDAITRHGGRVEKFIGDAVMAVWGTPVAHEDDAERAVRSALEIVDQVAALGAAQHQDLQARAGVLTGEAVAALDATDQGLVTGDLVNTASRLQSAASPGQVLVGERTYRSVSASIACVPVDDLTLKGKSEQLAAWRAVRVISELGGSNRGTAPEPPFVGRDEELRLIKELLHATGREGRPRLLHITGVAGIGKSRLVWELAKYVDGLTETFLWHDGRCPAYGDGVTFWALAEMVRGRARIADTDDDETTRRALAACLEEYVPDAEERRWIEPRLAHLLGLGSGGGDREELFGAWRRFFERVAEQGTVVLVFEDLQWADTGLLDFVDSLLQWSRTSPIVVLSLARPELADRRPGWGSGVRNSSVLHLDRLSDADIEAMVTGYVEGLPSQGLARLVARAEGVPMYAVETVRMLAARGVLEQTGETYLTVGELGDEIDIPETLHALVAARLDTLPDAERALVQDASVAGHSFTLATVAAVAGRDPAEVEPLLRTLVRKEVFDQDVDPRSAERGQYRFVQSVIQEVAYSTLSKAARRAKHLACAQWMEALDEDELAGVVASHYLEAYRSDPSAPDAEDIADHARSWLLRSSDRASSLGSMEQALAFATQALELATTPADRAALNDRAARSASFAGDQEVARAYTEAAVADYRTLGDLAAEADLLVLMGRTDPFQERTARLAELVDLLPDSDRSMRVVALAGLANEAGQKGDPARALAYSDRAISEAQLLDEDDEIPLREALAARGFAAGMAGRHIESRLFSAASTTLARRIGSPAILGRALVNHGIEIAEDDPRGSLELMVECVAMAEAAGMRPLEELAMANAAESAVDLGEWEFAERALERHAEPGGELRDTTAENGAELNRAMLLAHRGDPAGALALLADLEVQRREIWTLVLNRTWFLRVRSLCRYLAGDDARAVEDAAASLAMDGAGGNAAPSLWIAVHAGAALRDPASIRSALEASRGLRGHWTRLVRDTATALAAVLEGDSAAGEAVTAALAAWSAENLPLDHAFATLSATYVLADHDPVRTDIERARAYLEALRAAALLARYDRALA